MKRIGVLTSGGDTPGMNCAIRSVFKTGVAMGMQVMGIYHGYKGLIEGRVDYLTHEDVENKMHKGGTVLRTARSAEFMTEAGLEKAISVLHAYGIEGLVVIGGDGSFKGACALADLGIPVIGIPGTIDLDIACTDYTIGFDTAANTAMEAIDRIRDTSSSHERCSIVEVMGRSAGYIALYCGVATGAEDILMPESFDGDEEAIIHSVMNGRKSGKKHHLIINAEGVGHSEALAKKIEAATGIESRATILGYLQRGGSPSVRDRIMATRMGVKAVELIAAGSLNRVVAFKNDDIVDFEIHEALDMKKNISDSWLYMLPMLKR